MHQFLVLEKLILRSWNPQPELWSSFISGIISGWC